MESKMVCEYLYPVCHHECGELLSPSETHICPTLCQKWIICFDWTGHQVVRKCGEENVRILAHSVNYPPREYTSEVDECGAQMIEKMSVAAQEDNATRSHVPKYDKANAGHRATTEDAAPTGSTQNKMGTFRDAPQPVTFSPPGKTFPVFHLKSATSTTAAVFAHADSGRVSPVAGPSSRFYGPTQQHSEEVEPPSASNEASVPFSFLWGGDLFETAKVLILTDGFLINEDTAWKMGFAKCTNGHLFPGNLEFCDTCGASNEFYLD